jgi:hypothetical protein
MKVPFSVILARVNEVKVAVRLKMLKIISLTNLQASVFISNIGVRFVRIE